MNVNVTTDIKDLIKKLDKVQKKQLPFALSKAINSVAFDCRKTVMGSLDIYLDRPTPFTKKGVMVQKSTKKNPTAHVGFRGDGFMDAKGGNVAKYMRFQIEGGTRLPKKAAIPVPFPKNIKLNKYGNLAKNKVKAFLGDKDKYFSGVPRGATEPDAGIWERMPPNSRRKKGKRGAATGKIKMVIGWEPKADYSKRFPFKRLVEQSVRSNFRRRFESALSGALKTAR